jgi:large subunit ribosomal protein L18e
MRSGPTNPELKRLIQELKKGPELWQRIAHDLEKPSRIRREVNLSRINRYSKENDVVIVPGKVLASGELDHSVTIAAWRFSRGSLEKMKRANSQALSLEDALKKHKSSALRILG